MRRWPTLVVALFMLYLALLGFPAVAFASEGPGDVPAVGEIPIRGRSDEFELQEAHLRLLQCGEFPGNADGQLEAQFLGNLSEAELNQLAHEMGESMFRMDEQSPDISAYRITPPELTYLLEYAINSRPDLWFLSNTYSYRPNPDGTVQLVMFRYVADRETIIAMQQRYYSALDDLLSWVPKKNPQAEQVKAVHDWLVRNVAGNELAAERGSASYGVTLEDNPWSAYTTLVNKSAVCQGYSLAFAAALNALGIDCCLSLNLPQEHGWNRVKLDGNWYHVDVTWDDPVPDGGFSRIPKTTYFLKSDVGLRAVDSSDVVHQSWTLAQPVCTDTRYDNKTNWPTYDGPVTQTADPNAQDMYRLYNPNSGEHFYTANVGERNTLRAMGWDYEGVGWVAPKRGNAVWRLYDPVGGKHHYTISKDEHDALLAVGWKTEGVGWYSDPSRRVPLLRLYSPADGEHHYTTDKGERDALIAVGWQDEGIGWYGVASGSSD